MIPSDLQARILNQLPKMNGWCDPKKALDLAEAVLASKPSVCVEIGVFAGKSLIATAMALEHVGSGKVWGIDPWAVADCLVDENEENKKWWSQDVNLEFIFAEALKHLSDNGLLNKHAELIRQSSLTAWRGWPVDTHQIDILHIDGNHSEWASSTDVVLWLPYLKSGGMLFMDDYDWESTQTAKKLIERQCVLVREEKLPESHYAVYRKK